MEAAAACGREWRRRRPAGAEDDGADSDASLDMEVSPDGRKGSEDEDSEIELDIKNLPETPETCLQMNLVYQEIIEEKIKEVNILLSQNKEQQEKLTRELAGPRVAKSSDGKAMPGNVFLGHFMKPYFKDKTSGIGPPANSDTREKAMQGIKPFEDLTTTKWKSREKLLLRQSVVSDRLQRLLQPKLLKLEYLTDKRERSRDENEKQILTKLIREVEREMNDIEQLPEKVLLGERLDKHDWDKIANVNFEGSRSAKELQKYWQNAEHPSISKKEWSEEEIEKLKEVAARHKCLSWATIAQELGTQRTAFQCLQKFQANNREFKRGEWAPEEDQMLVQLVQEMRVGSHIPYRKIAYYMEGRDSAQLIYRWTKRLDPSLRHGSWTPEEDALLLKAVAKYGEQDWYKIRTEVPGRSDVQCRERYLCALHYDIKKGKWSEEEEKKLVELIEQYGVGHWAKIASELPHRSGSQCLSKWKILLGCKKNRRRRKQKWSSDSSSEDSDSVEEEEEEEEESTNPKTEAWEVPSIDLWVPTRPNPSSVPRELASVTVLSKGFDENRKWKPVHSALPVAGEDQTPEDLESWTSPSVNVRAEEEAAGEDTRISGNKKDSWRLSLTYVRCVLRRNSYALQRRSREISRKKRFASALRRGLGRDLVLPPRETIQGQRDGMLKMTLNRRLMMAVAPWAGSRMQAWAHRIKSEASRKSKVEFIFKHLQTASLKSTPLFTLFIQLLHIDVNGCIKIIQKRKSRQLKLLKAVAGNAGGAAPVQAPVPVPAADHSKAPPSQDPTAQPNLHGAPSKRLVPLKAKEGPLPAHLSLAFPPSRPSAKCKTVSEMLREKRGREAKARRVILAPQLLLPPSVIIRLPAPAGASGPSLPSPPPAGAAAPPGSSGQKNLASLREPRRDTGGSCDEEASAGSKAAGRGKDGTLPINSQGVPPATRSAPLLPTQSHLTLQISAARPPALVASLGPSSTGTGTKKAPRLAPAACSPGPAASPQDSVKSVPPLAALQPGSHKANQQILPITWLLTGQGLLPLAVVSHPSPGQPSAPSGLCVSPSPSQAAEASPVSTGQPGQGAFSSRLQKGGEPDLALPSAPLAPAAPTERQPCWPPTGPPDLALPSAPLAPAAATERQPCLPPTGPLMPPLPSASVGSVQDSAHLKQPPQDPMAVRSTHPPALPEGTRDPPPLPLLPEDFRLLSPENVAAVKAWSKGGSGPSAPSLDTSLPYLPPFVCSLKTLSALLRNKAALEQTAAGLGPPEGQREGSQGPDQSALREVVRQRLHENPAYQLLRARFLAAFTIPAALAVLPPPRVTTTLSESWWESRCKGDSPSSSSSSSEEEAKEVEEEEEEAHPEGGRAAESLEEPGADRAGVPRVRRSTRFRRRRRHL